MHKARAINRLRYWTMDVSLLEAGQPDESEPISPATANCSSQSNDDISRVATP